MRTFLRHATEGKPLPGYWAKAGNAVLITCPVCAKTHALPTTSDGMPRTEKWQCPTDRCVFCDTVLLDGGGLTPVAAAAPAPGTEAFHLADSVKTEVRRSVETSVGSAPTAQADPRRRR